MINASENNCRCCNYCRPEHKIVQHTQPRRRKRRRPRSDQTTATMPSRRTLLLLIVLAAVAVAASTQVTATTSAVENLNNNNEGDAPSSPLNSAVNDPAAAVRAITVDCATPYTDHNYGHVFQSGDVVSHNDRNYQCKPWPATHWCSSDSYAPGISQSWGMAWTVSIYSLYIK
eukprot:scaffold976_cov102-Skeletonema_dohrnii-CCMP3373.AAC.11